LIVRGSIAFHRRDLWIMKTLPAFAGDDDDIAFAKLPPNEAGHVALCFRDQRF